MARSSFDVNSEATERLLNAIAQYEGNAGLIIDEVLHNQGAELIREEIMRLLPESGRKWNGKRVPAKRTQPFTQENGRLSVTVKTKAAYHYLYFPDDGTNTRRHVGYKGKPREFMHKGAENRAERIIDLCINRLIEKWEGG